MSDTVGNLSCWGMSWDSVHLSWDPPANPNGQILSYQVRVDSMARPLESSSSELTVSGLVPDQTYMLSVSAVNSAGLGDPMNCTAETHPESGRLHTAYPGSVWFNILSSEYSHRLSSISCDLECIW